MSTLKFKGTEAPMNVIINMICTTNIEFTFARKAGVQQMFSLFRSTSVYWNPPSFT